MNRQMAEGNAELMLQAGIFAKVVTDLIQDNVAAQHAEEPEFLNEYRIDGLMMGLKIVAHELCARSEWITKRIEEEEKEAQAALQRRKGQDMARECDIGGKSGTRRAA